RSFEQGLDDLARCGAAEVVVIRHPRGEDSGGFLDELEGAASRLDFATASFPLSADTTFDALEATAASVLQHLRFPALAGDGAPAARSTRPRRGIVALLDAFAARHGTAALGRMDNALDAAGLAGDLAVLTRAYVAAKGAARAESKRIEAW